MAESTIDAHNAPASEEFAALNPDDFVEAQSKSQAVTAADGAPMSRLEMSLPSASSSEQAPVTGQSPFNIVDPIERISQRVLAPGDIVSAAGPRTSSFAHGLLSGFTIPQQVRPILPGSMKASEATISKTDVRNTLSASLAPRSGILPSQPFRHDENTFGRLKSPQVSSPANIMSSNNAAKFVQATAASASPISPANIGNLTSTFDIRSTESIKSIPAVAARQNGPQNITSFPAHTSFSSSKKQQRTYVLPDGTVTTSGKGLGRGRPGIKRGPRKSKLATEIKAESPKAADDIIVVPSLQKKHKRASSGEPTDPTTPSEPSSRATSEEFMPENTQTRSGRQALKPSTFVPSSTSTPVAKKPRLSFTGPSVPKPAALAKIKRKTYRGREHAALCEHCLRGHGPLGNVIVFCDACNKCWHQRCHEPQVSEAVIKDTKAEWYCNDCERIINGPKKGGKKTAKSKPSLSLSLAPGLPVPLVGASSLTREQREAQLSALSKEKLIEMLMRATDLAPALPLFDNPNPPATPQALGPTDSYPTPTQEEDDYEYLYDEHAALYPEPGNGVKLPPESIDLAMLLEGPDCRTFSHTLYSAAQKGLIAATA